MSNELSTQVVQKESGNLSLSAVMPGQMATCQQALIEWCDRKITLLESDANELRESVAHARKLKWKTSTIARHLSLAEKRIDFYQKMHSALVAGYVIVPNFPVTLFAIRTEKGRPVAMVSTSPWDEHAQKAEMLPEGEGEYKNPLPEIFQRTYPDPKPNDPAHKLTNYFAENWRELDFPVTMAKPQIMEAATNAMALKIFDQFGVLPSPYKKQDPMIVAQLVDPRSTNYTRRLVTFMIAWNLDTRLL